MGLMDKVRAQGTQIAQIAQETAREGKVKLDQANAKRRADAMFRDLGATVYAERTGRGTPDSKDKIDRLVEALSRQEASQGLGDPDGTAPGSTGPDGTGPGSTGPGARVRGARGRGARGRGARGREPAAGQLGQRQAFWAAVADGTPVEVAPGVGAAVVPEVTE